MAAASGKDDHLLSIKEAAVILGVSLKTAWTLVKNGEIKARKYGNLWRIRREDIHNGGRPNH